MQQEHTSLGQSVFKHIKQQETSQIHSLLVWNTKQQQTVRETPLCAATELCFCLLCDSNANVSSVMNGDKSRASIIYQFIIVERRKDCKHTLVHKDTLIYQYVNESMLICFRSRSTRTTSPLSSASDLSVKGSLIVLPQFSVRSVITAATRSLTLSLSQESREPSWCPVLAHPSFPPPRNLL